MKTIQAREELGHALVEDSAAHRRSRGPAVTVVALPEVPQVALNARRVASREVRRECRTAAPAANERGRVARVVSAAAIEGAGAI